MNNADLAEIRALLQAGTPPERRPQGPLLGAIRALLPLATAEARPPATAPRRVGLHPADPADIAAVEELLLTRPLGHDWSDQAVEARRRAFGQKLEPATELLPRLRLAAPAPSRPDPDEAEAEPGGAPRRRVPRPVRAVAALDETPYLPEDMADGGDAERLYADSGLFGPRAAEPSAGADPQRLLLLHLERVFVAELAALSALAARP